MRHGRLLGAISAVALTLSVAPHARAQEDDRVYVWDTPPEANVELSLLHVGVIDSSVRERGFGENESERRAGHQFSSLEAEYGLTDRWTAALYGDFELSSSGTFRYTGVRAETRYRLFDRYTRLVDTALSFEFDAPRPGSGDGQGFEARLIMSRDFGDFRAIANPVFELPITGREAGEGVMLGIASGLYFRRWWRVQPLLEYFATFGRIVRPERAAEQRHVLYPGARIRLASRFDVIATVGVGLTESSDRLSARLLATYEFETIPPSQRAR